MVFPDSGAVSPKLKLGENERPAVMITMCTGCHDNEQLRSNPGLELANAFGVFQTEPVPGFASEIVVGAESVPPAAAGGSMMSMRHSY